MHLSDDNTAQVFFKAPENLVSKHSKLKFREKKHLLNIC